MFRELWDGLVRRTGGPEGRGAGRLGKLPGKPEVTGAEGGGRDLIG